MQSWFFEETILKMLLFSITATVTKWSKITRGHIEPDFPQTGLFLTDPKIYLFEQGPADHHEKNKQTNLSYCYWKKKKTQQTTQ